jgi:chromosomal replication initiator protein
VTPVIWQTWIEPIELVDAGAEAVELSVPSEFYLGWIQEKYLATIESAVAEAWGTELAVVITARSGEMETISDPPSDTTPAPETTSPIRPSIPSGPKYDFDNFVVGRSNRFAYAAAMAVAEQPATHYNPLFIYGAAGLGKTHLLHAVAAHSAELRPGIVTRYVTSEDFFNDFVEGIRRKRMDEFKSRYRRIDVLLLDDVQFFEGKEQILEEFFHTFNSLHQAGKQLVITSDRHPRHLSDLEERLRSRFEWGLLTDIQPPDVETRLAILRKNAEFAPKPVPKSVLEFIATHVSTNIRELEGALTRITAYSALTQSEITLEMATEVLQDLVPTHAPRSLGPEEIMDATAAAYGYTLDDLVGPSRRQPLARARQTAMYLCRELTDLSLPRLGQLFGGRDHTTILHGTEKIKTLMLQDKQLFDQVTAITQQLRGA